MKPRPTTATLTVAGASGGVVVSGFVVMAGIQSGKVFFHDCPGGDNVRHTPVPGLAFDDEIAFEIQLPERCEKSGPIHLAGPAATSSPQVPAALVRVASLMWTCRIHGASTRNASNRIALVVKNHVRGIEVHSHVRDGPAFAAARPARARSPVRFPSPGPSWRRRTCRPPPPADCTIFA